MTSRTARSFPKSRRNVVLWSSDDSSDGTELNYGCESSPEDDNSDLASYTGKRGLSCPPDGRRNYPQTINLLEKYFLLDIERTYKFFKNNGENKLENYYLDGIKRTHRHFGCMGTGAGSVSVRRNYCAGSEAIEFEEKHVYWEKDQRPIGPVRVGARDTVKDIHRNFEERAGSDGQNGKASGNEIRVRAKESSGRKDRIVDKHETEQRRVELFKNCPERDKGASDNKCQRNDRFDTPFETDKENDRRTRERRQTKELIGVGGTPEDHSHFHTIKRALSFDEHDKNRSNGGEMERCSVDRTQATSTEHYGIAKAPGEDPSHFDTIRRALSFDDEARNQSKRREECSSTESPMTKQGRRQTSDDYRHMDTETDGVEEDTFVDGEFELPMGVIETVTRANCEMIKDIDGAEESSFSEYSQGNVRKRTEEGTRRRIKTNEKCHRMKRPVFDDEERWLSDSEYPEVRESVRKTKWKNAKMTFKPDKKRHVVKRPVLDEVDSGDSLSGDLGEILSHTMKKHTKAQLIKHPVDEENSFSWSADSSEEIRLKKKSERDVAQAKKKRHLKRPVIEDISFVDSEKWKRNAASNQHLTSTISRNAFKKRELTKDHVTLEVAGDTTCSSLPEYAEQCLDTPLEKDEGVRDMETSIHIKRQAAGEAEEGKCSGYLETRTGTSTSIERRDVIVDRTELNDQRRHITGTKKQDKPMRPLVGPRRKTPNAMTRSQTSSSPANNNKSSNSEHPVRSDDAIISSSSKSPLPHSDPKQSSSSKTDEGKGLSLGRNAIKKAFGKFSQFKKPMNGKENAITTNFEKSQVRPSVDENSITQGEADIGGSCSTENNEIYEYRPQGFGYGSSLDSLPETKTLIVKTEDWVVDRPPPDQNVRQETAVRQNSQEKPKGNRVTPKPPSRNSIRTISPFRRFKQRNQMHEQVNGMNGEEQAEHVPSNERSKVAERSAVATFFRKLSPSRRQKKKNSLEGVADTVTLTEDHTRADNKESGVDLTTGNGHSDDGTQPSAKETTGSPDAAVEIVEASASTSDWDSDSEDEAMQDHHEYATSNQEASLDYQDQTWRDTKPSIASRVQRLSGVENKDHQYGIVDQVTSGGKDLRRQSVNAPRGIAAWTSSRMVDNQSKDSERNAMKSEARHSDYSSSSQTQSESDSIGGPLIEVVELQRLQYGDMTNMKQHQVKKGERRHSTKLSLTDLLPEITENNNHGSLEKEGSSDGPSDSDLDQESFALTDHGCGKKQSKHKPLESISTVLDDAIESKFGGRQFADEVVGLSVVATVDDADFERGDVGEKERLGSPAASINTEDLDVVEQHQVKIISSNIESAFNHHNSSTYLKTKTKGVKEREESNSTISQFPPQSPSPLFLKDETKLENCQLHHQRCRNGGISARDEYMKSPASIILQHPPKLQKSFSPAPIGIKLNIQSSEDSDLDRWLQPGVLPTSKPNACTPVLSTKPDNPFRTCAETVQTDADYHFSTLESSAATEREACMMAQEKRFASLESHLPTPDVTSLPTIDVGAELKGRTNNMKGKEQSLLICKQKWFEPRAPVDAPSVQHTFNMATLAHTVQKNGKKVKKNSSVGTAPRKTDSVGTALLQKKGLEPLKNVKDKLVKDPFGKKSRLQVTSIETEQQHNADLENANWFNIRPRPCFAPFPLPTL